MSLRRLSSFAFVTLTTRFRFIPLLIRAQTATAVVHTDHIDRIGANESARVFLVSGWHIAGRPRRIRRRHPCDKASVDIDDYRFLQWWNHRCARENREW